MRNITALKIIFVVGTMISFTQAKADSMNEWQRLVTKIAQFLTGNDSYDNSWKVEYNSKFNNIQPGSVLQSLSNGSGMNVISKKCSIKTPDIITTSATSFGTAYDTGNIGFSAGATIPEFMSNSLASANVGLSVNKNKQVNYEFNNIEIQQIDESSALETINSPLCFNSIKHRSEVYMVRGVLVMQLSMSQGIKKEGEVVANLTTIRAAKVGFDVAWDNNTNWQLVQTEARPWFRIVTKFKLNRKGNVFELAG